MRTDPTVMVNELPLRMAATEVLFDTIAPTDDADGAMPADLRSWLVRLRLLEGVPFANLVADTELLPPESIRWFYVDRMWTDALVQGALAVGTVNTDDRAHLTAAYPAVRAELDQEERNVRRRPGAGRRTGEPSPISGFVLRSAAVAGWPGLHVRAYTVPLDGPPDEPVPEDDVRRMRLLRLERLAPAVLLCLFDGIPEEVHVEEPRQGVQFGIEDASGDAVTFSAEVERRDPATFEDLPEDALPVPLRPGGDGVIHVQALVERLATGDATAEGERVADHAAFSSADLALQLIRRPYRQRFGERQASIPLDAVFRPTIAYESLVAEQFVGGDG